MAFILSDRVKETTSTTGTGTYTLGGASTGFESFASIGNSNTTYYCCTDGTDFEVGIGTYTASGTTLARTTILQSSNSDNAVNWSAGTREIFCTLPAEKSVVKDASNHVSIGEDQDDISLIVGKAHIGHVVHNGYGAFSHYNMRNSTGGYALLQSSNGQTLLNAASGQILQFRRNNSAIGTFETDGTLTLNNGATINGATTINADTSITSTADGGPLLSLISNDHSDATNFNQEGAIQFFADNDANESTLGFKMYHTLGDVSDGNEDGWLYLNNTIDGNNVGVAAFGNGNFYLLDSDAVISFFQANGTSYSVDLRAPTPTAGRTITLPDASGTVLLNTGNQTLTGDLTFPDDEKAVFGTGSDLTISHESSGNHSVIRESGTGNLYIDASNLYLRASQSDSFAAYASFTAGGATQLYHNGTEKFITETTGIKATGNVLAEDGYVGVGDISADNWAKFHFTGSDPAGFSSQYTNAAVISNEQGTANQHLYLFDTTANDTNEIFGIASGTDPIFSITGQGHIIFKRPQNNTSYDVTLACPTPTASRTITFPDASGTVLTTGNPNTITDIGVQAYDVQLGTGVDLIFEGATANDYETTLTVQDPTADRTITLPNASGSVQLNRGNGEINGGFQNFQQDYQSSSYFVAGEYIEIATITPTTNSSNFNFTGTMMAQVSSNVQVLDVNVGIRYNSSGSFGYGIIYNSQQVGDDYIEPVLWVNTSTNTIKLLIQGKTGSIHKVGVNLCFFQRGNYDDTTWNTTVIQDTTSVPSGYTEYIGEKTFSSSLNGAVELYHNNVKTLETTSTGVTVTGLLSATTKSFDIEHPTKHNMRLKHGSLEGPEHGVYVRGILTDENVIELPDYWTGLVHEDSITAQLTPKGHMQQLYVKEIRDNKVYVENTSATKIDCFYFIQGNRKDTEGFEVEYES